MRRTVVVFLSAGFVAVISVPIDGANLYLN